MQRAWQAGGSLAAALNAALAEAPIELPAGALCFVPQAALPPGEGYEAFVRRSACVPTRNNWHDFFNGLVWLHHGALKARMNALHDQAQPLPGARRGPLRDALTLLDENGALLQAPPALCEALAARDWQCLFVELRPLWREARLHLIGHALLEKLMQPRKSICAHVLLQSAPGVADELPDAAVLAGKPWHPLPVLGLPGWWAANADPLFYADSQVFRPAREAAGLLQTG